MTDTIWKLIYLLFKSLLHRLFWADEKKTIKQIKYYRKVMEPSENQQEDGGGGEPKHLL
jgi:hypothetical protein